MTRIEIKEEDFKNLALGDVSRSVSHYMCLMNHNPYQMIEQILQDHEKAKNWDSLNKISEKYGIVSPLQLAMDYDEIVNRLKELIDNLREQRLQLCMEYKCEERIMEELQKIRDGK